MCVHVCGGSEVAVSKPFLNLFHWDSVPHEKGRTAVAKIMETDSPQMVFAKQYLKVIRYIIRLDQMPHLVYKDVLCITLVVAVSTEVLIFVLFLFQLLQILCNGINKRECSVARSVFHLVLPEHLHLSVNSSLRHGMAGCDGAFLEIHRAPLETYHLTPSEAVASCDFDQQSECIIIDMGKELLRFPTTPLPGVQETLEALVQRRRYRLVVFTKGELMDQEGKLARSGLEQYFSHVETVSNKTEQEYRQLCENLDVAPEQTLMVGNSFRSDIAPALAAGAYAIHIPYHVVWELEKSEEFPHDKLRKITHFGEILDILG